MLRKKLFIADKNSENYGDTRIYRTKTTPDCHFFNIFSASSGRKRPLQEKSVYTGLLAGGAAAPSYGQCRTSILPYPD